MKHHLFVCSKYSKELAKHSLFRDYLRDHSEAIIKYGKLIKKLEKHRFTCLLSYSMILFKYSIIQ
ncbi:hypothetical protein CN518_24520 [Bacillus anthracis]|nr:hypothetical protein CN518_24520 [Bacillus anthracis]